jgi:hypothetical protein
MNLLHKNILLLAVTLALFACSEQPSPTDQPESPAPPPTPAPQPASDAMSNLRKSAPAGAVAYFISPENGARVTSPVRVLFGLKGMGVAPAGIDKAATGHHHLLIDTELANPNMPLPMDANHRHFGGGQTEVLLELAPGSHRLQLVLGDYLHIPHEPPVISDPITIEVVAAE